MDPQWGGTEILQTPSCSGQVFERKPWQETPRTEQKTQYRHGARGHRQFKSPVVWAWVPHLSPTQRIHGIDAPETWLQRQTPAPFARSKS